MVRQIPDPRDLGERRAQSTEDLPEIDAEESVAAPRRKSTGDRFVLRSATNREIRKQISFYATLRTWQTLRAASARRGVSITDLVREPIEALARRLESEAPGD